MVNSNHMQDDWPRNPDGPTCQVMLDAVQDDNGQLKVADCPNKPYAIVGGIMLCERHYEEAKENARKQ